MRTAGDALPAEQTAAAVQVEELRCTRCNGAYRVTYDTGPDGRSFIEVPRSRCKCPPPRMRAAAQLRAALQRARHREGVAPSPQRTPAEATAPMAPRRRGRGSEPTPQPPAKLRRLVTATDSDQIAACLAELLTEDRQLVKQSAWVEVRRRLGIVIGPETFRREYWLPVRETLGLKSAAREPADGTQRDRDTFNAELLRELTGARATIAALRERLRQSQRDARRARQRHRRRPLVVMFRGALIREIRLHRRRSDMKVLGSFLRGHATERRGGVWTYIDTGEPTVNSPRRPCGHCGLNDTPEGHDGCLGELPGVMNACCGHGCVAEAYIQYLDGLWAGGEEALASMAAARTRREA